MCQSLVSAIFQKSEVENINPNKNQTLQHQNTSEGAIEPATKKNKLNIEDSVRYDLSLGHFGEIDRNKRVRCKNEGCQLKTSVFCTICKLFLCFQEGRNCVVL